MGSMRAPCQMGKPNLRDQLRPCSSREAKKSASPGFPLQLQIPQDGRGGDSGATDVGVLVEKDRSSKSVTVNCHLRGQAPQHCKEEASFPAVEGAGGPAGDRER